MKRLLLTGLCLFVAWSLGALDWQPRDGHRLAPLTVPQTGGPGFTLLEASALGVGFTNFVHDGRTITNRNLLSGSGLALGDVDGDGHCDLFLCGLDSPSALFRNLGTWRFTNITQSAIHNPQSTLPRDATGATFADVDGDGDLDLLLNSLGGGTRLLLNNGAGSFTDATVAAGLSSLSGATSLALADVDGDGDLDVYVCNFRPDTILDQPAAKFTIRPTARGPVVLTLNGRPTTEPDLTNRFEIGPNGDVIEFAQPDVLWLNDGQGRFTAAAWTDGSFLDEDGQPLKAPPRDWGLAAQFYDFNHDGRPDLYVCNDLHTPDRFWVNASTNGRVRFRAIARTALRSNSTFSMGVDFGDLNRDGFTDLFTVDMLARAREHRATQLAGMAPMLRPVGLIDDRVQVQRNALQLNRGDDTFAEAAFQAGVEASDWSWGPVFLDVDLDGYEDILIPNGQLRDFQDSDGAARLAAAQRGGRTLSPADIAAFVRLLPRFDTPNAAFRNRTGELPAADQFVPAFADVSAAWGFTAGTISQGIALADLDGDGDLDLVCNNLFGPPGIYRNESSAPRVSVRLKGCGANTRGLGAKLVVRGGAVPEQQQEILGGGRYLAGDEAVRTFATGRAGTISLEVRWPSGAVSRLADLPANSLVEVTEPSPSTDEPRTTNHEPRTTFTDVSHLLNHVHPEEPFNDFERQPLLPHRLSQLGPGVTWADLNGDGHDDLIIGTGRGGSPAVFDNDGKGGFTRRTDPLFNRPAARDLTTLLPLGGVLLAGSANYEDGQTNGGSLRIYDLGRQVSGDSVLGQAFSAGPLAAADVNGDGTLEIFVGGRALAGRWPAAAPSLLLQNVGGRFSTAQRFDGLGLLNGACFTDTDGDGDLDLVVACEWGPLKLFRNEAGKFTEWNAPVALPGSRTTLAALRGLWTGLTSGDFDGDGRLDLVAGNWGWNTRQGKVGHSVHNPEFHAVTEPARRLHFGDLGGGGGGDLVESMIEPGTGREWPAAEFPRWARALPWLRDKFPTLAAFSKATVPEVFGDRLQETRSLDLTWLGSAVLLNRGDHYELRPLPAAAQLAPGFGICVGDYDGDGHEDVFLAQNWFCTEPLSPRNDGGRGLWLRGDGTGNFTADLLSGVEVYGEQRGAALADYDADGRADLVVTQNGTATKLFRNTGAQPGLRVRLPAAGLEPRAAGVAVRLAYGSRRGPWREAHLGAGYWSVDSATLVLGLAEQPTALEARWPGQPSVTYPLPVGARDVTITPDGTLKVRR